MFATRTTLMLLLATLVGGCAVTPKIQLNAGDMTMEVKKEVPLVTVADYSPDGKSIVTGGMGGAVRLWDLADAKEAKKFKTTADTPIIRDITYSPDGKTIAVSTHGVTKFTADVTTLWDVATGLQIKAFAENFGGRLSFSPDGKLLLGQVGGFGGGAVNLLDIQTGVFVLKTGSESSMGQAGFTGRLSPDGKYIFLWGAEIKTLISFPEFSVSLSEIATGREVWRKSIQCDEAAFSPDGQQLLLSLHTQESRGGDFKISFRTLDTATGAQIKEFGHASIPGGAFDVDKILHQVRALAFSPDGKHFLSGNLRGEYKLWDFAAGTMVRQFKTVDEAEGTVMNTAPSVKFSPDGKTAVAASLASTRLYDVSTGDELATMISYEDGEWLVTTPDGYYNSSEKADQYLSVTVGGKPYTTSQLRESFYRPDIVKVALAGHALSGLRKVADIKPPPNVVIINTPASVSSDQATVSLEVKDQGGGIGDVRLYLNGTAVVLDRGNRSLIVKPVTDGAARTFSYQLQLISGKNSLRAIAFNADNSMQSTDAIYEIDAKIAVKKPALHALVVGIQQYENPKLTLKYPVADAMLFADTLDAGAAKLFDTIKITRLTTRQETTSASITAALDKMRTQVGPNDLFVFYVASHGTVDDGEYYLITSNVGATSTEKLKRDALNQNSLKELISNIPTSKKLIVLDTCNAGKLGDAIQVAMLTRGMSEDTAFKVLSRAVGSTILSAANSQQEALEGYRGHGLFTYVLSEGLQGKADLDKDGFVKTTELASYIEDEVPELAEKVFNHKQYPVASPSGQGFPVARSR